MMTFKNGEKVRLRLGGNDVVGTIVKFDDGECYTIRVDDYDTSGVTYYCTRLAHELERIEQ